MYKSPKKYFFLNSLHVNVHKYFKCVLKKINRSLLQPNTPNHNKKSIEFEKHLD